MWMLVSVYVCVHVIDASPWGLFFNMTKCQRTARTCVCGAFERDIVTMSQTFKVERENSGFRRLNHKSNCHNHGATSLSPGPPHYLSTRQPAVGNTLGVSLSLELHSLSNWFLGSWIPAAGTWSLLARPSAWAVGSSATECVSQTMPPLCPSYCITANYQCKPELIIPGCSSSCSLNVFTVAFAGKKKISLLTVNRLITTLQRVRSEPH